MASVEQLQSLIEPVVEAAGFELVRVALERSVRIGCVGMIDRLQQIDIDPVDRPAIARNHLCQSLFVEQLRELFRVGRHAPLPRSLYSE